MDLNNTAGKTGMTIKRVLSLAGGFALMLIGAVVIVGVWETMGGTSGGISLRSGVGMMDGSVSVAQNMVARDFEYATAESAGAPMMYGKVTARSGIMPPMPSPIPASTATIPAGDRKVIQNASLELVVKNADDAAASAAGIAAKYQGFVDSSNVYEYTEGQKSGSVTIRIPSASFIAAIADLKALAVKVTREQSNAQDVTAQFVDLEAAIKNYKAEEAQYQEIMKRAVKIEDVLNVASRLSDVRGRIEQVQGQLNYLSRQVDMSTITVSLTSQQQVEVGGIMWRPWQVVKQATKDLLVNLTKFVDFLVSFLFYLPILILKVAFIFTIILVLWKLGKWVKGKVWPVGGV